MKVAFFIVISLMSFFFLVIGENSHAEENIFILDTNLVWEGIHINKNEDFLYTIRKNKDISFLYRKENNNILSLMKIDIKDIKNLITSIEVYNEIVNISETKFKNYDATKIKFEDFKYEESPYSVWVYIEDLDLLFTYNGNYVDLPSFIYEFIDNNINI